MIFHAFGPPKSPKTCDFGTILDRISRPWVDGSMGRWSRARWRVRPKAIGSARCPLARKARVRPPRDSTLAEDHLEDHHLEDYIEDYHLEDHLEDHHLAPRDSTLAEDHPEDHPLEDYLEDYHLEDDL
jgi:hypothetical protein